LVAERSGLKFLVVNIDLIHPPRHCNKRRAHIAREEDGDQLIGRKSIMRADEKGCGMHDREESTHHKGGDR
jgi:hypothetical protein